MPDPQSSDTYKLYCRICEIPAKTVRQEGHRDLVRCLTCGTEGDAVEVMNAAIQHFGSLQVREVLEPLEGSSVETEFLSISVDYSPNDADNTSPPDFIMA